MAITALPTPPSSTAPSTFNAQMDAFLAALPQFVTETNALSTQLNSLTGQTQWVVAGGTVDAITGTFSPAIGSLTDGLMVFFRATGANTSTTPTFNANGLGAKTITKKGGQALAAGDIFGNLTEVILRYNLANTRWELMNPAASSEFTSGTFTVTDTSGASLTFTKNEWYYRAHATFYLMWGELTWPSTASGASASLSGFPFTSRANTFAIGAWIVPFYSTNGGYAISGTSPSFLYINQNNTTATFRDYGGTIYNNSVFSTLRMGFNSQVPR